MIDMAGDINDMINLYNQLRQNPMQVLSRRFNIPQGVDMSNPNSVVQHLLNTGQVTQSQVNRAMSMQNNPLIRKIIGR